MSEQPNQAVPQQSLTLFRSVCIIVGVIVGSGIFESPPRIAGNVDGWWGLSPAAWVLIAWALGGLLSFVGALCYAELATTYPRQGGDYVYLNRAFGKWSGFLFGWARLSIIQAGSIGAMAYVFGDYASRLLPLGSHSATIYAVAGTIVFTGINIIGVREGTLVQNVLTVTKVLGLCAIVFVAFTLSPDSIQRAPSKGAGMGFGMAMIFVLWTYGGWNEIAYVAAEVRDPKRNILRSLLLGLAAVTVIYLVVNTALIYALGVGGLAGSEACASDVLALRFGETGARLIAGLVVISALGALNGFIFTSPRVYYAMGTEHKIFAPLGKWNERFGTPVIALIVQGVLIITLVIVFGSREGFDSMVSFTAAAFWFFLLLNGLTLFVLRFRDRDIERPYKVFGYPIVPLVFIGSSAYMLYSSVTYVPKLTLYSLGVLIVGLPLYWISQTLERGSGSSADS